MIHDDKKTTLRPSPYESLCRSFLSYLCLVSEVWNSRSIVPVWRSLVLYGYAQMIHSFFFFNFAFFNAKFPWQEMVSLLKLFFIFHIPPLFCLKISGRFEFLIRFSTKSEVHICPAVITFILSDP